MCVCVYIYIYYDVYVYALFLASEHDILHPLRNV